MHLSVAVLLLFVTTLSVASDTLDFLVRTEDTVYTAFLLAEGGQSIFIDADTLHLTKRLDLLASNVNVVGKSTLTTLICPPDSEAMYIEGTGVHLSFLRFVGCESDHSALKISAPSSDYGVNSQTNTTNASPFVVRECVFEDNLAKRYIGYWRYRYANGAAVSVYGNSQNIVIDRCSFKNNLAYTGGAIYIANNSRQSVTILNSVFVANEAMRYGGAIHVSKDAEISVSACSFVENKAYYEGAAINIREAFGSVIESSFTGGHSEHSGGAIAAYDSDLTVEKSTFTMNKVEHNGGALYCRTDSFVSISESTFTSNYAHWTGGAIYVEGTPFFKTKDLKFESNVAGSSSSTYDLYYAPQMTEAVGPAATPHNSEQKTTGAPKFPAVA